MVSQKLIGAFNAIWVRNTTHSQDKVLSKTIAERDGKED